MNYNLITILGPTAVGKTKIAAKLAFDFDGEIISADSRQVYRLMDIGTGKDLADYNVHGLKVNYHLIDIADPNEEFNLYRFTKEFYKSFEKVNKNEKTPFLVGGTGLYLHSVLKGYKLNNVNFENDRKDELQNLSLEDLQKILKEKSENLHNTTDLLNKERIIKAILIAEQSSDVNHNEKINSLILGIRKPREEIKKGITTRLKKRLKEGMIEEVENLLENGVTYEKLNFFGLEYRFVSLYIKGELNYNDMFQKLNSAIHNFAKRQMTWFRKMEKEGIEIIWIDANYYENAKQIIQRRYFN